MASWQEQQGKASLAFDGMPSICALLLFMFRSGRKETLTGLSSGDCHGLVEELGLLEIGDR